MNDVSIESYNMYFLKIFKNHLSNMFISEEMKIEV